MTAKPILTFVVGALAGGVAAGVALADDVSAPPPPADDWHAQLQSHGNSDRYVVDNKLSAGASTGWHSHPEPASCTESATTPPPSPM